MGGEDCFCAREWTAGPVKGDFGVIDRKAIHDADVTVTFADRPAAVADFGFATGAIDTTSFERVMSPSAAKIGWNHGNGCSPELFSDEERRQGLVPDKFNHEIALGFNLKGQGLVVLTACSHRGVVNAVRRAQVASGVQKVHAVIGGFHLVPFDEAYVRQTVAALKQLDVDYIIPLHCSGEPFYEIAKAEMPSRLLRSYTGTRFVFSA
jgi:7,8-dihydropterin-6-yl-methyl-4-(beta-D-ribofuranosyl)aminobenzene 5'-phosphate synthase